VKGWLLTISILTSMTAVFLIQEHISFNLGYILATIFIAIHFFVVALYFTREGER
jgi:hypothetical protein